MNQLHLFTLYRLEVLYFLTLKTKLVFKIIFYLSVCTLELHTHIICVNSKHFFYIKINSECK